MAALTEQVAALATNRDATSEHLWAARRRRCFGCGQSGHLLCDCPFRPGVTRTRKCFSCGQPGHIVRNSRGASMQGSGRTRMKPNIIVVAAVKNKAATTAGSFGGVKVEVMLDSGSSVSLVRQEVLSRLPRMQPSKSGAGDIKLLTAPGEPLQVLDHVQASIKIGDLERPHGFVVVEAWSA